MLMKLLPRNNTTFFVFIFITIILLPFNGLPYFPFFGEMAVEGAFYPLLVAIFIWLLCWLFYRPPIQIPVNIIFAGLLLFFLWIILSGAVNFNMIITSITKGRTGGEKYILQILVLGFGLAVTWFFYHFLIQEKNYLAIMRTFMLVSFLIIGLYSIVEIGYLLGNDLAYRILEVVVPYIREPDIYPRLTSVSGEPSWFAMYASFILPWVISFIFTEKRINSYLLVLVYFLVMIGLTFSRTAYFITLVQLAIFIFILALFSKYRVEKKKLLSLIAAALFAIIIVVNIQGFGMTGTNEVMTSFTDKETSYAGSNIARLGSQITAVRIGVDYPIFGVGLGQYGFHMPAYVPDWAWDNKAIQDYMDPDPGSIWAPVHGIYPRILAELGFVGLLIWLAIWSVLLFKCWQRCYERTKQQGKLDYLGLALIISIIGVLMSGLNTDTFRFMGYWISLSLGMIYVKRPILKEVVD